MLHKALLSLFPVTRITKESVMNYVEEILQAIFIGLAVAKFLYNIGLDLKAIELCKESLVLLNHKALKIEKQLSQIIYEQIYYTMFNAYRRVSDYTNALACGRKLLAFYQECSDSVQEGTLSIVLAHICQSQNMYAEAKELYERATPVMRTTGNRREEAIIYGGLGHLLKSLGEYVKANKYYEKALAISIEIGFRDGEALWYLDLGTVFRSIGEYVKANEYYEKALAINIEIGRREGEAICYGNLGRVFQVLGEYVKAKEYHEKALAINIEIGRREGETICYGNLGRVFQVLGEYVKAKEYHEKALAINIEIGCREGEAICYGNLGRVFRSLGEHVKAKEYHEKALAISIEIDCREGEAICYGNLGRVFRSLGEYVKAKEYYEKALAINIEIGRREGEATCYGNLGIVFQSLGEYVKAKEYHEKALAINIEIGHREGEATCYGNLGTVFQSLGEYVKAKECHEKALAINIEIGSKDIEITSYSCLGSIFSRLGENDEAAEYYKKASSIINRMEDCGREHEARNYNDLGTISHSLGKYGDAIRHYDKALAINKKIGDRREEAKCYVELGSEFECINNMVKAIEYHEKALAIATEIGDKTVEGTCHLRLGRVYESLSECVVAEEHLKKALSISKHISDGKTEFDCYLCLALTKLSEQKVEEAFSYLDQSTAKFEELRGLLKDSDLFKISFADVNIFLYKQHSSLFCDIGNPREALHAAELGRARALTDLLATQYSAIISPDPQSWTGIENVMKKEGSCACLYISYFHERVFLWILKKGGAVSLRQIKVDKKTLRTRLGEVARHLDDFFAIMVNSFRSFGNLPEELCEDRSLNEIESNLDSFQEENLKTLRRGKDTNDSEQSFTLFYEILINPVSDLLKEPEIIIVPDRGLYRVPFPALLDNKGKYLTETFRIRVIPSLTTLKLIQDSPTDYHSQTGALLVGDPDVGEVIYRGRLNKKFVPLPGARKEAEMIGRLLGVRPLLGQHATKQAVLERIKSVSLIHIAAHGNAERGEIALAPSGSTAGIPRENDYLLKMSDISQVQVRAKLVVLSCCHSGRGQIRAEGVVGIARALLGSGARSVLVALWALEDRATEQLMSRFYENLVRGKRASESLHEAIKWMRDNGFTEVSEWAPFMLIGDNVTFAFGK